MLFILFGSVTLNAQNSYTASAFTQSMTNIIGATTVWDGAVSSYDDEYSLALPLGFTFKYFGTDYTEIYASTNGWISFYSPTNSEYINSNIPDAGNPYGVIAPFWDDFTITNEGITDKVSYVTTGIAPNRVFTIEYFSVTRYSTTDYTDFQVKLYETSNSIEFHYGTNSLSTGSASIGIENYGGTIGYCGPNCGTSNLATPSSNYRFDLTGYWVGATSTDWGTGSNWADGNVPSKSDDVIIPSIYTNAPKVNITNAVCSSISVAAGAKLSIANGKTLAVSGVSDINGKLNGFGTFDANGLFDAAGGTISMSGRLKLGSTVISLGTLSTNKGTIEYDGANSTESSTSSVTSSSASSSPTNSVVMSGLNPLPTGDATLTVYFKGDIDAANEFLEIYDEDNVLLFTSADSTTYTQCGTSYSSQSHTITQAAITSLVSDGTTKFKWVGSADVGFCTTDVYFKLEYLTQGIATILSDSYYNLEIDCDAVNSGTLNIDGDLTISNNGELESQSSTGDITLNGGSFINNGTFDLNSSDIIFAGGNDVTCGAITSNGEGTLVMNKTSASNLLTLTNDVELKGLTLNSGRIVTDANELTIRKSSPGSPSSHVVGLIKLDISTYTSGSIEVPTGDGAVYRPVFIHPEASGSTIYSIKYYNSSHSSVNWALPSVAPVGAGVHHVAGGHWWDVKRISGFTRVKLGFNWNVGVNPSQVDDVDAVAEMLVTHWTGAEWENVMGSNVATGSASSGSVTSDYIDEFSPFTEGSSGPGNPLPVDLLSFNASCSHDIVDVDFTVLSQINNDYFLVERSEDAVNWEVIGNIDGAGNTNTQMDYNFVDMHPLATLGYYRLTQVDFDAKSETFWPVTTECSTNNTGLDILVYPNPIIDHFTIEIDLDEYQGDDVYYTILDIRGSIVKEDKISLTRGFNKHEIQIEDLSTGAYMLRFANTKNHIKEQRIMVK